MKGSLPHLLHALIVLFSFYALAQDDSCSQPLDKSSPTVKVFAPDLSALVGPGERIRYFYEIVVHGPNGNDRQYMISNSAPNLYSKTSTTALGLGFTIREDGEDVLKMTVTLKGEFSPLGATSKTQKFNHAKEYIVKTAGLCLDEVPLRITPITIQLPQDEIYRRFHALVLVSPGANGRVEYISLDMAKVLDTSNKTIDFRFLDSSVEGEKVQLAAIMQDGKDSKATISLDDAKEKLEIELTKEDFVMKPIP